MPVEDTESAQLGRNFSGKWWDAGADLPLNYGDTDWMPDPEISRAIEDRLAHPLAYPPSYTSSGVAAGLVEYYRRTHGLDLPAAAFWLGSSCLSQSYHVFAHLTGPGDEVLYWSPAYLHMPRSISTAGAIPVALPAEKRITEKLLAEHASDRTRAIYLVNPHNPTGKVYSRAELQVLARFAQERDLLVISNELHSRLVLDGAHVPFAALGDDAANRCITLSGASKSHNLAGLGGSFAFSADVERLQDIRRSGIYRIPEATSLQQAALVAAYREDTPWFQKMLATLRRVRDACCDHIRTELPLARLEVPAATFFLWADFSAYLGDSSDIATEIRQRCGLVVGPGPSFGGTPAQVRLSLSLDEDLTHRAMRQLSAGLNAKINEERRTAP
jgi:cystathionine beta-lyase